MITTRMVAPRDAEELAGLTAANRDFLAPYEPEREAAYFTRAGQLGLVADQLQRAHDGSLVPHVIVEDGAIIGRITLNGIVRGPFQSASVGYWVAESAGGRGVASEALGLVVRLAFDELRLHRLEAGTMLDNLRSQRVLAKHGFVQYGEAPSYLRIAGEWRDHALFQLLNPEWAPS